MWTRILTAILTIVVVTGLAREAGAQYIYLDSNGNGVHDTGDRLNANGAATTVDLYLRTDQNRDGSPAVCDMSPDPLGINAYSFNLLAVGGTVAYSGFVNRQATMPNSSGELNPDGVRYKNGHYGIQYLPPGLFRLCTLTITGMSGTPRIDIVDLVSASTDFTGFGTQCPSRGFDNTYRLDGPNTQAFYGGPGDFTDWDGLGPGGGPNNPPAVTNPGNKTVNEFSTLTFTATATDPDVGQTITWSLTLGTPAANGATINPSTGAFTWTPSPAQANGVYPLTITATDNGSPPLSGSAAFTVTVGHVDSAPVIADPGNKTTDEQVNLAFTVTATDSDQPPQTITWSLLLGTPSATGATIQASTGAFNWTPSEAQGPGIYPLTIRAEDNATPPLSDNAAITITVNEVNSPPVLAPIGNKAVAAGSTLAFTATATDADIPANALCFSLDPGSPPGATMTCSTGAFMWTPSLGQIGSYVITVRVTDNGLPPLSDSETITVLVGQQQSGPTANAGGPYTGIVNSPVSFDGTGSSDPNGDPLTYAWSFGDGNTGTGATPMHTYTAPGNYNVVLRVTDPEGNYDEATTTVTILAEISTALVLRNGKSTINLGDDILKLGMEELEQPYENVLVGTLRLSTDFPNAGTVAECAADSKHTRIGDLDRNGIPDLELRFPIACIRDLFRNTPNNSTVNLILTGQFQTSSGMVPLRGMKVVTIKRGGGGSAPVLAYPNPFNPQGRLSFHTTRPGSASIQLFDLQGRLVRTLLPQQFLGAGAHEVAIDGLNDQGVRLSSGVYFYRVSTADGATEGSINVLK